MPTIVIPDTLSIDLPDQGVSAMQLAFVEQFIFASVLRDKKFGVDVESLYAAVEIKAAFKGKVPGDEIELTEDQYKRLSDAVSKPSEGYNPTLMIEAKSFLDAVLKPKKA